MEDEVLTPIKKTPNGAELLTIVGTEFHVERRESYYKAQFIDLDGKRQVILIGRELFTYPSKVVAQLLKANATLPDDPNAAVKVVKRALANRSKKVGGSLSALVGTKAHSYIRERRSGLLLEYWSM